MRILDFTGDCADGAFSGAERTTLAELGNDLVLHEVLTSVSGAGLVYDVSDVFIAEEVEGRKNGVGRGLTESAEGSGFDVFAEFFELVDILERAVTVGDLFEGLPQICR